MSPFEFERRYYDSLNESDKAAWLKQSTLRYSRGGSWSAIQAIAPKIGCTPETLRSWHKKHIDQTIPASVQAQSQEQRIKELERENKELKQANEIIRKAAAFFAQAELDRPPR